MRPLVASVLLHLVLATWLALSGAPEVSTRTVPARAPAPTVAPGQASLASVAPTVARDDANRDASDRSPVDTTAPGGASSSLSLRGGPVLVVGRAVDDDGRPIAGAEVELSAWFVLDFDGRRLTTLEELREACEEGVTEERLSLTRVVTGVDGHFRLGPVERPDGPVSLRVEAFEPMRRASGGTRVAGDAPFVDLGDLTLRGGPSWAPRARVTVTVHSGGRPVAGARVGVSWYAHSSPHRDVVYTDDAGRVRVVVDSVPLRLEARAGAQFVSRPHVPISDADVEVTLDLEPERRVSGSVVDAQGAPVKGAWVDALGRAGRRTPSWVASDDAGAFALPELPGGPLALVAWDEPRPGEVRVSSPVIVEAGSHARPVLTLVPAAALRVAVDRSGDAPFVEQRAHDGAWVPVWRRASRFDDPSWLAPGPYRVRPRFGLEGDARPAWISAGETHEVRADGADRRSGRRVAGRVVRPDGTPIRWARLGLLEGWWELAGDSSGDDGTFVLWGPRRRSTLQVDGGAGPFEVDLPADGDVDLGDLVVEPAR